jgi:LAO/AO transport system kinase
MTGLSTDAAAPLVERLLAGDRRALARAITLVENGDPAGAAIVRAVYPHTGSAEVVGFTGPPGAGKSSLLGVVARYERDRGRSLGVLAVDPSSPFSSGALLGDRVRLTEHFLDGGVFIRSMATRGALGGLSEAALQAALLMDAGGRDLILLETVGVGQAEVDVLGHADTVVLVLMPGSGDSVQALKAGVMEIPDVIVINKADHPMASATLSDVKGMLALAPRKDGRPVPVILTCASSGQGVEQLVAALDAHRAHISAAGSLGQRRRRNLADEVLALASRRLRRRLASALADDPALATLIERVATRELDPASAAEDLLERLGWGS